MFLDTINVIKNQLPKCSSAEYQVGEFIIENPQDVLNMSTNELAEKCNTSPATIIRFCKKVGIDSFKSLKINLAKGYSAVVNEEEDLELTFSDDSKEILNKITNQSVKTLMSTKQIINIQQLKDAARSLATGKKVVLYGAAGSGLVAMELYYMMIRVNENAHFSMDLHITVSMVANLRKDDVLFVVSTSGKTKDVIDLIKMAKERNVKVIALTSNKISPVYRLADICLVTAEEEMNVRIGTMTTRIAQVAVINALFIKYCSFKGKKVYEYIIDTYNVVKSKKTDQLEE